MRGGNAIQGQTVTASNTLADADGLGVISYQWLADGAAITGATSATWVLSAEQTGKTVALAASYIDGHGTPESVLSAGISVTPPDTVAPTLLSASPADNAAGVAPASHLTLTFSEPVQLAHPATAADFSIVVKNLFNSADNRSISLADSAQVTVNGSTVTIHPATDWLSGAHYAVTVAGGALADAAGNAYAGIAGQTVLDFTVAGSADPAQIHGIVYDWKNHALLDGVSMAVTGVAQPVEGADAPLQLRNLTWDAAGHGSVEVYAHAVVGFQDANFQLGLSGATGVHFTADSALPADWSLLSNIDPTTGNLLVAGFGLSSAIAAGDIRLGTVAFETGALDHAGLQLVGGAVGEATASSYGVAVARDVTGAQGGFTLSGLLPGAYDLTASLAVTDSASAITSADALAVLRIAIGLNPNPDPDGSGPLTALPLSPYQVMAADVVGTDGKVTSADALAILRMAVKLPTAPAAGWFFVEETRDFWDETTGKFTLDRSHASWDHSISTNAQVDQPVNLVGVLKGDVNGSWTAPATSADLDVLAPGYFDVLHNHLGMPVTQWGVYP